MKNLVFYTLLSLVALSLFSCSATRRMENRRPLQATPQTQRLTVDLQAEPNIVQIRYMVQIPARYVPRKAQVIYESYLTDGVNNCPVSKIYLNGRTFQRVVWRQERLEGQPTQFSDGDVFVSGRESMTVVTNANVPFEEWMSDADLETRTSVRQCGVVTQLDRQVLARGVEYIPLVVVSEPVALPQPIIRQEQGIACLTYVMDGYQVNPAHGNNAAELDKMESLLNRVLRDSLLSAERIVITGICSPDGLYASNQELARNRAETVKNYLVTRLGVSPHLIHLDYIAEDWVGLRDAVEKSDLQDKSAVLSLIDSSLSPDAKSRALIRLPQYQFIKTQILPGLRRVQYTIFYTEKVLPQ